MIVVTILGAVPLSLRVASSPAQTPVTLLGTEEAL